MVILVDHWLQESPVKICMCSLHCICLPSIEILKRSKYGWFTRLNKQQLLESNIDISKYIIHKYTSFIVSYKRKINKFQLIIYLTT